MSNNETESNKDDKKTHNLVRQFDKTNDGLCTSKSNTPTVSQLNRSQGKTNDLKKNFEIKDSNGTTSDAKDGRSVSPQPRTIGTNVVMLQKRKGSEDLLAGLPESLVANLKKPQIRKSQSNVTEDTIIAAKTPRKDAKEKSSSKVKEVPRKK